MPNNVFCILKLSASKMLPMNFRMMKINAVSINAENFSFDNKSQHFGFNSVLKSSPCFSGIRQQLVITLNLPSKKSINIL